MARWVLAGDVGGTKTNLAIYGVAASGALTLGREASLPSRGAASLEALIGQFLAAGGEAVAAAAFGIAGPVLGGVVDVTNLPWHVEAPALARRIGCPAVRLLNDLETTAYGALHLDDASLLVLSAGSPFPGNRAVIAAGTGLGQGLLFWDGARYHPSASEGGHVDFGPRDAREDALAQFLRPRVGRVTWERVLSGPGLHNLFAFLVEGEGRRIEPAVQARLAAGDASAVIGELGVSGGCPVCVEAVELFVSLYGSQAGNLALSALAVGGVYVGGGIVTKLLPKITGGSFLRAFLDKAPHQALLRRMPLSVILTPKASLLGAAHVAAEML
ncbi:glucokinase [bacterium]|nr:glucokinase [bacterium]